MNELIKINTNDSEKITVSARDLHQFLEVGTQFKDWVRRMFEYGFEEGIDFNMLKFEQVRLEGNREVKREMQDYQLTIDTAKEIAMLQRNEKGKQARQYFIQLEKEWNSPEKVMARALLIANKKIEILEVKNNSQAQIIAEYKPKIDYVDTILKSKSLITVTAIAKDYGMSAKTLNKLLYKLGVQFKQSEQWFLYAKYQSCGYTQSETMEFEDCNGRMHTKLNTKWTQKGRLFLYELLKENGYIPEIEMN